MKLEISTFNKSIAPVEVSQVSIPTEKGETLILPGHAPMISRLGEGTLSYQSKGENKSFQIAGGTLEVSNDSIIVACDQLS